jgi:hypothetical protein
VPCPREEGEVSSGSPPPALMLPLRPREIEQAGAHGGEFSYLDFWASLTQPPGRSKGYTKPGHSRGTAPDWGEPRSRKYDK